MNADEIVKEWRTGCTHYGPRGVEGTQHRYVGGCQECTDAMVVALLTVHRDAEDEVGKLRRAIWQYQDRPGCNPSSRRLQMRRLLWAAGDRDT